MKNRLSYLCLISVLFLSTNAFAQSIGEEDRITASDIQTVVGEWTGTLTYIDYSSGEPFTMPANLLAEEGKNQFQVILNYVYPNEPHANSKGKLKMTEDGSQVNISDVIAVERKEADGLVVTTEFSGKDNNQKATIRNNYIISQDKLVINKEVKFEDSTEWLKRNEYNFTRKED